MFELVIYPVYVMGHLLNIFGCCHRPLLEKGESVANIIRCPELYYYYTAYIFNASFCNANHQVLYAVMFYDERDGK
jgi:hypothetical protein